jgi:hypothetical protein
MIQEVQEQRFLEGFAVGELTSRLEHTAPLHFKEWIPTSQVNLLKGVLYRYNYAIIGISTHPSQPDQILLEAEKTANGARLDLVQAFLDDDRFIEGLKAGSLAGLLRYSHPPHVEQWVQSYSLGLLRQIIDDNGYVMTTLEEHPSNLNLVRVVAQPAAERLPRPRLKN